MSKLLSISQVAEWQNCKYRWKTRYIDHLKPKILDAPSMTVGQVVHLGIAAGIKAYARYPDSVSAPGKACHRAITVWKEKNSPTVTSSLDDEEFDIVGDIAGMSEIIALRALRFINLPQWETIRLNNGSLLVEKQMVVPLGVSGWRGFQSYFDWVARDRETGMIWLIDHKVRKTFLNEESEETNLQGGIYQRVLMNYGIEAVGTRTLQIKAAVPVAPKVNKDGSVSRTAVRTDWETYRQTVLAQGLDPVDYEDMRFKLSNVEWFDWISAYRSWTEVDNMWDTIIVPVAREILKPRTVYTRNLSYFSCMRCWAKPVCLAELRDQDADYIRQEEYILTPDSSMVYAAPAEGAQ